MADLKKDNEKISREVGAKDNSLSDSDLSNVAGGRGQFHYKCRCLEWQKKEAPEDY